MNESTQKTVKINNTTNYRKISSDLDFIKTHMNNISNKTKNCIDTCQDRHSVESKKNDNKLYIKINNLMNEYYNTQIKLMEKLNNQSKNVIIIGEKYYNLDKELATKAGDL